MLVPSISEGFGLIFLEAMNAEIPIIGFDVPATNEIIVHEETGLLIPAFDTTKLGTEIIRILSDRILSDKFALAGNQRLKSYFSLDRMTNATLDFYQTSLAEFSNISKAK
jgi:glycosyltransferase involved in cell wall biosynthesis